MFISHEQKTLNNLRKIGYCYAMLSTIGFTLSIVFWIFCSNLSVATNVSINTTEFWILIYIIGFLTILIIIVGLYFIIAGLNYKNSTWLFWGYLNLLFITPAFFVFWYFLLQKRYWIIEKNPEVQKIIEFKENDTKYKILDIQKYLNKTTPGITKKLQTYIPKNSKNSKISLIEFEYIYWRLFKRAKQEFNVNFSQMLFDVNWIKDVNWTFAWKYLKTHQTIKYYLGIYLVLEDNNYWEIQRIIKLFKKHKKWSNTLIMVLIYGRRIRVIFRKNLIIR